MGGLHIVGAVQRVMFTPAFSVTNEIMLMLDGMDEPLYLPASEEQLVELMRLGIEGLGHGGSNTPAGTGLGGENKTPSSDNKERDRVEPLSTPVTQI